MRRFLRDVCYLVVLGVLAVALSLLITAFCPPANAQTAPAAAPNPFQVPATPSVPAAAVAPTASFLAQLSDPVTIGLAAYDLSQVATAATAWKFTAGGKTYQVSAVRQTGIAAAVTIGAAAAAHKWPKLKPWLTVILGGVSAYYGGEAYYRAQNHGTP